MLGLRHHRGVAIDLFQGDITTFVCDAVVDSAATLTGLGVRHVGIPAVSPDAYGPAVEAGAEVALLAVKAFAERDAAARGAVRRVTFVLSSLPHYHVFQETLFRLFPEDA